MTGTLRLADTLLRLIAIAKQRGDLAALTMLLQRLRRVP